MSPKESGLCSQAKYYLDRKDERIESANKGKL